MSTFDVRGKVSQDITEVKFADENARYNVAITVKPSRDHEGAVKIEDEGLEYVLVHSAEHAENLAKALTKAVQLGWLK